MIKYKTIIYLMQFFKVRKHSYIITYTLQNTE